MTGGTSRRVILKPAGLNEKETAKLREGLAAAVQLQRQLSARSPHVLQLLGGLQESPDAFSVQHEPAEPLPTVWFDDAAPRMGDEGLLRWAVALFDALRAAHTLEGGRPTVHGGLCGGVLLTSPDGIEKITDFGFAPAILSALGPERFKNLAVSARPPRGDGSIETGAWEVLDPDVFDRDDRICAFIDPEKYGTKNLGSFEPGSDVIAAGFLLHLAAEHQHPYLSSEPDAQRLVELCEYMAMGRYNSARRKELRESANPAVLVWCEQVARALERLPQKRPTAVQVLESFAPHIKPVDAGEIARRRLQALVRKVHDAQPGDVEWGEVLIEAQALSACDALGGPAAKEAQALIRQAQVHANLLRAEQRLAGEQWKEASDILRTIASARDPDVFTPDLEHRLRDATGRFERCVSLDQQLDDIESRFGEKTATPGDSDPEATHARLDGLLSRVSALTSITDLPDSLRIRRDQLQKRLSDRLKTVAKEAERLRAERAADHARAAEWIAQAETAWKVDELEFLQILLDKPPDVRHWPAGVQETADRLRRASQNRRAAQDWLEKAEAAVSQQRWNDADQLLARSPASVERDPAAAERARELRTLARRALKELDDHQRARVWLAELKKAADAKRWKDAADVLVRRPNLEHWPTEVIAGESSYRPLVEQRLEAIELDRRRVEAEHQQVREWFGKAKRAAENQEWNEALSVLAARPQVEHWPDSFAAQADDLERECRLTLGADAFDGLKKRTQNVVALADSFVQSVVAQELGRFVHARCMQITIDEEEFSSPVPDADGRARLCIRLADAAGPVGNGAISSPFDFQIETDRPRVCDREGALRGLLVGELRRALTDLQRARAGVLAGELQRGLFPKAQFELKLDEVAARLPTAVDLLGSGAPDSRVEAEVAWDPAALQWRWADPADFCRHAIDIARKAARKSIAAKLLEKSEALRAYKSILGLEVASPAPPPSGVLPQPLALEARLSIRPSAEGNAHPLQTFSLACSQIEALEVNVDLTPAMENLRKLVVAAQNATRDAIAADIQARIKAAAARIKVSSLPKRIKQPVEKITFELKPKSGQPTVLTGTWTPESFAYVLPTKTIESLERLFKVPETKTPPAPAEPLPTEKRGVGPPAHVKLRGRNRAVIVLPAVVLLFAGTALVWNIASSKSDSHPEPDPIVPNTVAVAPSPNDDARSANENENKPDRPSTPTTPAEHASEAVEAPGKIPAEPPRLEPIRLTNANLGPVFDDAAIKDFIDPSQITLRFNSTPSWNWSEDGTHATAAGVEAQLTMEVPDPSGQITQLPLADVRLDVEAEPGAVRSTRLSGETDQDLLARIQGVLVERQAKSARDLAVKLKEKLAALTCEVTAENLPEGQLSKTSALAVSCDTLQPRRLETAWDRKTLHFLEEAVTRAAESVVLAHQSLQEVNSQISADHWIRKVSTGPVTELKPPDAESWTLAVTAPWAPANGAAHRPEDRLPLRVSPNPLTAKEDAGRVAQRILNDTLARPPYWQMVEKYVSYSNPNDRKALWNDLIAQATPADSQGINELANQNQFVESGVELLPEPPAVAAVDDGPEQLELKVRGYWAIRANAQGLPPSVDPTRLRDALRTATASPAAGCAATLKLEAEGQTALSLAEACALFPDLASTSGKARALEKLLAQVGQRAACESVLENEVLRDGATAKILSKPEAFSVLDRFWKAKSIAASTARDIDRVTLDMRGKLKKGSKSRAPVPTVFAEYFCGPRFTYAVVWGQGVDDAGLNQAPSVVRLSPSPDLDGKSPAEMGRILLEPLLQAVPKTIKANEGEPQLGIILAMDERLSVTDAEAAQWTLREQNTWLERLDQNPPPKLCKWQSLGDLRKSDLKNRLCDYWVIVSLADISQARTAEPGPDEQWALTALNEASRAAP